MEATGVVKPAAVSLAGRRAFGLARRSETEELEQAGGGDPVRFADADHPAGKLLPAGEFIGFGAALGARRGSPHRPGESWHDHGEQCTDPREQGGPTASSGDLGHSRCHRLQSVQRCRPEAEDEPEASGCEAARAGCSNGYEE